MRIQFGLLGLFLACMFAGNAFAKCGSDALGTSRTIVIDPAKHKTIRGKEARLGLRPKEVILTFDDGPIAGKTPRILKALKAECVKATFFYVGKMARAYPKLVRKVVAQGHTLGHHTHNHNRLPKYSTARASVLIDQGIKRLQKIAYGDNSSKPRTPFFRYPYLARNKRTDRMLVRKGLVAFGANIDALDWKRHSPSVVHDRIMRRLREEGRGIVLMHDIQGRTAKMLPRLLRSLKSEGYRIVHMVPKGAAVPIGKPALVASLGPEQTLSQQALRGSDRIGSRRSEVVRTTTAEPVARLTQPTRMLPPEPPQTNKPQRIKRTGITVASVTTLPSAPVVKDRESRLKSRITVVEKRKKKRTTKYSIRKRKKKRSYVVLAGNRRSRAIKTRRWKLRRSQWILR